MNIDVILDYQRWADRGMLEPLQCFKHEMNLLACYKDGKIVLQCPKLCSHRELGLAEYKELLEKTAMAKLLFDKL